MSYMGRGPGDIPRRGGRPVVQEQGFARNAVGGTVRSTVPQAGGHGHGRARARWRCTAITRRRSRAFLGKATALLESTNMPIFRMRRRLVASCTLLVGWPVHTATAQDPHHNHVASSPAALLLRRDTRLPGNIDVPSLEALFAFAARDDSVMTLRWERDAGLPQLQARWGETVTARPQAHAAPAAPLTVPAAVPTGAPPRGGARVIKAITGAALSYDSNLLRLPGGVAAATVPGASSKSDVVSSAYVGVAIDKPYRQQRFQLDATQTAIRHAHASSLDYEAFEYRGNWDWHITPRWGGSLSAERRVSSASFADTQVAQRAQRNLRTGDNLRLTADGALHGGWHAVMGAYQYQLKYDQGFLPQNSSRLRGAEAGVKYERAPDEALALIYRASRGDYLNRVPDAASFTDNAFRQAELELRLDWTVNGKSAVRARAVRAAVTHEQFTVRDFSGVGGEIVYIWTPGGKLRIEAAARRELAPWWQNYSSYRVDNMYSIAPLWQLSAKTALRARLERVGSDFRGPVPGYLGPLRRDTLHIVQLGAQWQALTSLTLDAQWQRQRRASNFPAVDFDANVVSLTAKLKF